MPQKMVLIDITEEEVELLKHCALRLNLDTRHYKNTGSIRKAVQYAAKMCAKIEKEFIDHENEKSR